MLNFSTFSVEGFWLNFFTKMEKPPEPTSHHNSKKKIILSLRAIYFRSLHYETPCISQWIAFIHWEIGELDVIHELRIHDS